MNNLRGSISVLIIMFFLTHASAQVPYACFTGDGFLTDEYVGYSVATDGQHVVIGTARGSAYLYDPDTQQALAKLTLPDPRHGTEVAIDGSTVVIGTRNGASKFDITNPSQIVHTVLEPDDGPHELFGVSVDVSGDTIIVGANGDDYAGFYTGSAFLFDATTGNQFAKLTASDGNERDNFGVGVAIDGDRAVVGAMNAGENYYDDGKVYLFDAARNVTGERELASYAATPLPDSTITLGFGYNVDIEDDDILAIQTGWRAYLWQTDEQPMPLPDSDQMRVTYDSICINDSLAVIGYPRQNYVAVYNTDRSIYGYLNSPDLVRTDFGASVAIAGDYIVVGAPGAGDNGTAYIYHVSDILDKPAPHGDLNGDGFVGLDDLDIILDNWNQSVPPGDPRGDVAGPGGTGPDGYIGHDDLDVVIINWNLGIPLSQAMSIPEPGTSVMLVLGMMTMLRRSK